MIYLWNHKESMIGGLSDETEPAGQDDRVLKIIPSISNEIRTQVAAKLTTGDNNLHPVSDSPITVLSYKTQVVAGTNYFVKTKIGKSFFLLRIYEPLPSQGQPSLDGVKGPIKESDPIVYF